MRQIRQVLRLHLEAGLSDTQVGRAVALNKTTVGLARATQQATNVAPNRSLGFGCDRAGNLLSKTNPQAGDLSVSAQTFSNAGRPQHLTDVTIGGIANTLQYDANGSISQYSAASGDKLFTDYDGDRRAVRIRAPMGTMHCPPRAMSTGMTAMAIGS